jgi:sigma-B regulation protein RsbU (phosphoserine phosphatase)
MSESGENPRSATPTEDLEDLYENAPCSYMSMQLDGCIFKANATLARWTGYKTEQLAGMRFQDLLTVGTRILYETSYAPLLSMHGAYDEISLDLRTASGASLAVFASGRVLKDATGQPHFVRLALFKAVDRRRYEREIVEARERSQKLEQVTQELLAAERETAELREQFIAVLGHDLRNPLASISSGARLLEKEPPAARRKLLLEVIQGSVFRMAGLIDNVLDFARGRMGSGIPLEFQSDILLAPLLNQVVAELRIGVPDRVIETDFDVPLPVKCDPSRIGQLVSNLLGNALTHGAPDKTVRLHADTSDGALVIWVANGGAAISPAAMERLFQPFFRGEVRASQQGLGLGLHIASEIAKAHGGTLNVASTDSETRFTFRMPLDSKQGAEQPSEQPSQTGHSNR